MIAIKVLKWFNINYSVQYWSTRTMISGFFICLRSWKHGRLFSSNNPIKHILRCLFWKLYESSRRKPGWRFTAGVEFWGKSCPFCEFPVNLKFVWDMRIFPVKFKAFPTGLRSEICKAIGLKGQKARTKSDKSCPSHRFFEVAQY